MKRPTPMRTARPRPRRAVDALCARPIPYNAAAAFIRFGSTKIPLLSFTYRGGP